MEASKTVWQPNEATNASSESEIATYYRGDEYLLTGATQEKNQNRTLNLKNGITIFRAIDDRGVVNNYDNYLELCAVKHHIFFENYEYNKPVIHLLHLYQDGELLIEYPEDGSTLEEAIERVKVQINLLK